MARPAGGGPLAAARRRHSQRSGDGGRRALPAAGGTLALPGPTASTPTTEAPAFDAERRATELAILDALRNVVDPEIGMNVVELALIKQILLGKDESEIKMILTTPFCPYAGSMVAQVQEQAEAVAGAPGQGHAARRALGPARRGPDVVSRRPPADAAGLTSRRSRPARATTARPACSSAATAISKDDSRAEAYGTIDEAVAALGLARAELGVKAQYGSLRRASAASADLILRFQRELFVVGAELATNPEAWDRLVDGQTRVSADDGRGRRDVLRETESRHRRCRASSSCRARPPTSAALELARTVLRRAERRVVTLAARGLVPGDAPAPVPESPRRPALGLARAAEQAEARSATPSRVGGRVASR